MAVSCFYGHDSERPDPPFPRTKLSNLFINGNLRMSINNVPITAKEEGKYRLFPRDRAVGDYPFTWHHNVPWNLLRSSWDLVVTFCGPDCTRRLFRFYVQGHPNEFKADALIDKVLKLQNQTAPTAEASGTRSLGSRGVSEWVSAVDEQMKSSDIGFSDDDRADLRLILCWGAWNLNEGPGVRIDDPDEAFDDFGSFDAHPNLNARYIAVARLNLTLLTMKTQFDGLAAARSNHAETCARWTKALAETLDVCEALIPQQRQIAFFDPMMWAPVTPSSRGLEQEFPKKFEMSSGLVLVERRGVACYIQMKKKVRPGSLG